MIYGPFISIVFIFLVAWLLIKKFNPQAVLLIAGLFMIGISMVMELKLPALQKLSGLGAFDLFVFITESFAKTNAKVGLMIMAIGGFVAYIDKIEASKILVKIALKPLKMLKKHPNIAAIAVIPLGQLLFICIPSAAGLGLLLMASVFPILTSLGVSRLSAVSVITACTALGMGPASAITASATEIAGVNNIEYFVKDQLPAAIPISLVLMITYFFVNRYFDKKESAIKPEKVEVEEIKTTVPKIYALIPILPLILLVVFSEIFSFFPVPIKLNTTTAMFISLFVALIFELIRTKNLRVVLDSLKVFWSGMGNIFKSVVTLIIAADIFAKGLISLGFIEGLVNLTQSIGFGAIGVGVVMTVLIFLSSMLMGSGNASFFAFAPLTPKIAALFGVKSISMILPMNLAASMGRTISPVAGVLIATAEIANVTTFQIVKRNIIPIGVALIVMLFNQFVL